MIIHEPCFQEEEIEEEPDIECTLAIIKPEAVVYRKQIERRIFEEGFEIDLPDSVDAAHSGTGV